MTNSIIIRLLKIPSLSARDVKVELEMNEHQIINN